MSEPFTGDKKAAFDAGFVMPSWQDAAERWLAAYEDEKALADDLADVLAHTVVGWEPIIGQDLSLAPEVSRVLRRYREARGR